MGPCKPERRWGSVWCLHKLGNSPLCDERSMNQRACYSQEYYIHALFCSILPCSGPNLSLWWCSSSVSGVLSLSSYYVDGTIWTRAQPKYRVVFAQARQFHLVWCEFNDSEGMVFSRRCCIPVSFHAQALIYPCDGVLYQFQVLRLVILLCWWDRINPSTAEAMCGVYAS